MGHIKTHRQELTNTSSRNWDNHLHSHFSKIKQAHRVYFCTLYQGELGSSSSAVALSHCGLAPEKHSKHHVRNSTTKKVVMHTNLQKAVSVLCPLSQGGGFKHTFSKSARELATHFSFLFTGTIVFMLQKVFFSPPFFAGVRLYLDDGWWPLWVSF